MEPLSRAVYSDALAEPAPQLGSANCGSGRTERGGSAAPASPRPDHVGPVHAVVVIEIRQVANCGETADRCSLTPGQRTPAVVRYRWRTGPSGEVARKWAAREKKRLVEVGVHQLEERPHGALRRPRIGSGATRWPARWPGMTSVPGKGKAKLAHTPSRSTGAGAQAVGKPLRHPALDPAGRHGDDLGSHRRRPAARPGHRPGSRPAGRLARICAGTASVTLLPCLAG